MFSQELQIMSKMSRVTSYDQLRLENKICHMIPTLLDFQSLVRKCLPFATIVNLAIFWFLGQYLAIKSFTLHVLMILKRF